MDDQNVTTFTIDELGASWPALLGLSFSRIVTLNKRLAAVLADNAALSLEVERLRQELRQAQTD